MKYKSFFDSFWFNAAMSVVSIVVLVESIIEQSYVFIVLWIVILYHFIRATRKAHKEKR